MRVAASQPHRFTAVSEIAWKVGKTTGSYVKSTAIKAKDLAKAHPKKTAALVGGGLAVVAAPVAIAAAGWGAAGVTGGSAATFIQSTFYGAWTCGTFSTMTSIGAAGLGTTGTAVVATGGAAAGAAVASKF
jgi:hypothetical protein